MNDTARFGRPRFGDLLFAAAALTAALAVGGMWLPWFRSGQSARNSFAAFRAAQILGIEWITPLRILWFLLPVLFLVAVVCFVAGLPKVAASLLLVLGVILTLGASLFWVSVGGEAGSAAVTTAGACSIVLAISAVGSWIRTAG